MESKHKLSINQWALEDRPREKMMEKGAAALSDAELLAILIGCKKPKRDFESLAQKISMIFSNRSCVTWNRKNSGCSY